MFVVCLSKSWIAPAPGVNHKNWSISMCWSFLNSTFNRNSTFSVWLDLISQCAVSLIEIFWRISNSTINRTVRLIKTWEWVGQRLDIICGWALIRHEKRKKVFSYFVEKLQILDTYWKFPNGFMCKFIIKMIIRCAICSFAP